MTLDELEEAFTNILQARIGWAKAEVYSKDVVDYMRRQKIIVIKKKKPVYTCASCGNICGTRENPKQTWYSTETRRNIYYCYRNPNCGPRGI